MTEFGFTLSGEEHDPATLVDLGRRAEAIGFDFLSVSDHFHPWIDEQGHSPFVWSVLGALAEATERISIGVGVTCPTIRIHPAILAQATATTGRLLGDRFVWGVGSGEALNEHILGDRWPPAGQRLDMLSEAVSLIRRLWEGNNVTFEGEFYTVENARIYDPPAHRIPIVFAAAGEKAARLAATEGDGLWLSSPSPETIDMYRNAGGRGPVYVQLHLCWASTNEEAEDTAHRVWPNSALPGQLSQDLPTPTHFQQAAELVSRATVAGSFPCGPDPEPVADLVSEVVDAGADHVYFHQIGPDQAGFLRFWAEELRPMIADDTSVDLAGAGSFPASDPPSWTLGRGS